MIFVSEIDKVRYSRKAYIAFLGITLLPILFLFSSESGLRGGDASAATNTPASDGWQLIITSMNFALHIFAPLLCAMVASDTIAGERSNGMLSLSLTKPVTRNRYLMNKLLVQMLVVIATFIVFAASSFVLGEILGFKTFYGVKNETGLPSTDTIIPTNEIWWRMLAFYTFAILGTMVVVFFTIAFSTYSDSVATVTALTVILYMSSEIFGEMIRTSSYYKYLLSPAIKTVVWSLLSPTVDWSLIHECLLILLGYAIIALGITFHRFNNRDI